MEAKFLAGALSFLSIFLAINAQSIANDIELDAAAREYESEPAIYYGDSNVNIGQPFSITCIIPITEKIHWVKDGEPITRHNLRHGRDEHAYTLSESAIEGEKHKIEAHISVRHALQVHEGRYRCNNRHGSYHLLRVRQTQSAAVAVTKSPYSDQYPTESGYHTIYELTPSSIDEIFRRTFQQQPQPGDVAPLPHQHKIKHQQHQQPGGGSSITSEHEHERRKHLYTNASNTRGNNILRGEGANRNVAGESDERSDELLNFAYLPAAPAPTSRHNEFTTMPHWQTTHSGAGGVGVGGDRRVIYSATPPDFPPPRITMLEQQPQQQHTVAPPDAPHINYDYTMIPPASGQYPMEAHRNTHQYISTASNSNSTPPYYTAATATTNTLQQTIAPVASYILPHSNATATSTTLNAIGHHHTQQPHQRLHHHHNLQQQPQNPYQTKLNTQLPYQQYDPQFQTYPPQFINAISTTSQGGGGGNAYVTTATSATTTTNAIGIQQPKMILPIKKGPESLVPNYDNEETQAKFYTIRAPLVLSCNVKVNTSSVLVWEKNGTDVFKVNSLKGRFRVIEAERKFIIDKTETNDDGRYSCAIGDVKKDINVIARVVVKLVSNSYVVEGEKLSISCTVVGTNPQLSWSFGNLTFSNSTGRYILKPENNVENAILSIENITMADKGDYHCIGRNEANMNSNSSVTSTSTVRVKSKFAAVWPFLGICAEVLILCLIILIYEKRRNKSELEESDTDPQEQ